MSLILWSHYVGVWQKERKRARFLKGEKGPGKLLAKTQQPTRKGGGASGVGAVPLSAKKNAARWKMRNPMANRERQVERG